MSEVVIKAENISKAYKIYENDLDRVKEALNPFHKRYSKDFFALRDVSFEIRRGENVGLVGKNGAGKSTLLKIITGVLTPSSGTLQVTGKIASLLELGAGFNPEMSGIENIYMSGLLMDYSRAEMDSKIEDIIAFADIGEFINQPVKTYSSGMFARLAFAVNAFVEPDILIVDEALSVGDAFFQSKCMDKMRTMINSGVTVIFVSHDTFAVKNLCQRAFLIDAGKLIMDAPAKEVVEAYNDMIIAMRRELSGNTSETKKLADEIRNSSKISAGKINLPVTAESLKLNQEIFAKNAAYQRIQNGKANFENIQLLDLNGEPIFEVTFAQEVILRMVIKFNADVSILGMSYHIRNKNGVDLVYTDSRFSDTKAIFDAKSGEVYIVDWKFKIEMKQDELYNFACTISIPVEETLDSSDICDFVPLAVQFKVVSPNKYLSLAGGYVHWHNDMEINKFGAAYKKCACCGAEFEKYLPIGEEFLNTLKENNFNFDVEYEMLNLREYACPNCGSADRERAFALVMKKILDADKKIRILDIAPRTCLSNFIKKNFPRAEYKTADLFMENVDYKLDIMDMKEIADGSIDFFICSHILEHVADDLKAMHELRRILSKDGCGIVVVPLDLKRVEIDEDPTCTDVAERWRRFGQNDHVRAYSKAGFLQRLKSVGFTVTQYDKNFFGAKLMTENGLIESSAVYVVK